MEEEGERKRNLRIRREGREKRWREWKETRMYGAGREGGEKWRVR